MLTLRAIVFAATVAFAAAQDRPVAAPRFANGLPRDESFFPIGVWLQAPANCRRYADLGINLYVGLWRGPTKEHLDALAAAGMRVICEQNDVALAYEKPIVVGWMHADEPDNAQGRRLTGYKPPVEPWRVVEAYERMHRADPTRPVLLNFGQGAAWDGWHGRGERSGHPEDYPEYLKGCDIASFDIYPVSHTHSDVKGRLEFVARGVRRLRDGTGDTKPVWAVLETAHVGGGDARPSPAQIRSSAWIAVCSGASGVVWFAHEFVPAFVEAGLLAHPEIAAAVRDVNAAIANDAVVLNSPRLPDAVTTTTTPANEVALRVHRHGGALYVYAASLGATAMRVSFDVVAQHGARAITDDCREFELRENTFADEFAPYTFRRYRIPD